MVREYSYDTTICKTIPNGQNRNQQKSIHNYYKLKKHTQKCQRCLTLIIKRTN